MVRKALVWVLGIGMAVLAAAPARAADDTESQLGGYVAGAAGWAFSFQPFIPALLPTGDAPAETTFSLSTANLKSGGIALGRASILYPGSAGANLGPLLGQAADPAIAGLIPPYPAAVEANADEGEKSISVNPAVVMRAFGSPTRSEGDVRTPDVNFPGVLKIDSVSSNSASEVTDIDVTSSCTVHLEGVSLLGGAISIKAIHSRSLTSSNGRTSKAEGAVQVVGLTVTGIAAELTADGIHVTGAPGGPPPALPLTNPDTALNTALKALGVTISLTRPVEHVAGGSADRLANGVFVSIINPALAGSHLDFTLASTASGAQATLPSDAIVSGLELSSDGPDLTESSTLPSSTDTSSGFGSTELGGLALGTTSPGSLSAPSGGVETPSLASYKFEGVSWRLVLLLLVLSALVARWLRRFLQVRLLS